LFRRKFAKTAEKCDRNIDPLHISGYCPLFQASRWRRRISSRHSKSHRVHQQLSEACQEEGECHFLSGPNPTTSSYNASFVIFYNASFVIFYNATGSLARFENKNILFYVFFFYSGVVAVNSKFVGLARFENKNILFYFEKRSSLLQRRPCSCKFKSRRIGSWCGFAGSPENVKNEFMSLSCLNACTLVFGRLVLSVAFHSVDALFENCSKLKIYG
jgi:hypothetical protein